MPSRFGYSDIYELNHYMQKLVRFPQDGNGFEVGIFLKVVGSNGNYNWWPLSSDVYQVDD